MNRTPLLPLGVVGRAIGFLLRILLARRIFPVFDLSALFSFPNLPAVFGSLFIGEPARVVGATLETCRHEVDCIPAPICVLSRRIEWHFKRTGFPGFLPRRGAAVEHLDDLVCYFLPEVADHFGFICAGIVLWLFWCHWRPPSVWSIAGVQSNAKSGTGVSPSKPDPSRGSPARRSTAWRSRMSRLRDVEFLVKSNGVLVKSMVVLLSRVGLSSRIRATTTYIL